DRGRGAHEAMLARLSGSRALRAESAARPRRAASPPAPCAGPRPARRSPPPRRGPAAARDRCAPAAAGRYRCAGCAALRSQSPPRDLRPRSPGRCGERDLAAAQRAATAPPAPGAAARPGRARSPRFPGIAGSQRLDLDHLAAEDLERSVDGRVVEGFAAAARAFELHPIAAARLRLLIARTADRDARRTPEQPRADRLEVGKAPLETPRCEGLRDRDAKHLVGALDERGTLERRGEAAILLVEHGAQAVEHDRERGRGDGWVLGCGEPR